MRRTVTTTHLVMNSPAELRPPAGAGPGGDGPGGAGPGRDGPAAGIDIVPVDPPNPQLNHALFMEIGTPWRWFSRLAWTSADWEGYVADSSVETWLGTRHGVPFGYFELQSRPPQTEIMFFGIFAAYAGQGLGGRLLTAAVERAWEIAGTGQVYVHTCTSDHPAALQNYLARGFTVEREVTDVEESPDGGDAIWASPAYYASLQQRSE
jgi:GNAT superfamily N-acetyltransferase